MIGLVGARDWKHSGFQKMAAARRAKGEEQGATLGSLRKLNVGELICSKAYSVLANKSIQETETVTLNPTIISSIRWFDLILGIQLQIWRQKKIFERKTVQIYTDILSF